MLILGLALQRTAVRAYLCTSVSGLFGPVFGDPVSLGYRLERIETICNTCEAHSGHLFSDDPEPGRLHYCMNAVALKKARRPEGLFVATESVLWRLNVVMGIDLYTGLPS